MSASHRRTKPIEQEKQQVADDSNPNAPIDVDVSDLGNRDEPFTPAQQKRVDQIAAQARRQGRGERTQPPVRDDSGQFSEDKEAKRVAKDERLARTIATAVASALNPNGQQPQSTRAAPVTAPSAPSKVDPMTSHGLTDIFNLPESALQQLGPQGLRAEFEKILQVGRNMNGAPPLPKRPGQNR